MSNYISELNRIEVIKMLVTGRTKKDIKKFIKCGYAKLNSIADNEEEWFRSLYYSRFPKKKKNEIIEVDNLNSPVTKRDLALLLKSFQPVTTCHTKELEDKNKGVTTCHTQELYLDLPNVLPEFVQLKVDGEEVRKTIRVPKETMEKLKKVSEESKFLIKELVTLSLEETFKKYNL